MIATSSIVTLPIQMHFGVPRGYHLGNAIPHRMGRAGVTKVTAAKLSQYGL